jgi:hypothetical protein
VAGVAEKKRLKSTSTRLRMHTPSAAVDSPLSCTQALSLSVAATVVTKLRPITTRPARITLRLIDFCVCLRKSTNACILLAMASGVRLLLCRSVSFLRDCVTWCTKAASSLETSQFLLWQGITSIRGRVIHTHDLTRIGSESMAIDQYRSLNPLSSKYRYTVG